MAEAKHDPATHSVLNKLGRLRFDRGLALVGAESKFSPRSKIATENALQKTLEAAKKLKGKRAAPLQRTSAFLRELLELNSRPTATQAAAALVLQHGFDSAKLHPAMLAAQLGVERSGRLAIEGDLKHIARASSAARPVLADVHEFMHSEPRALTSEEIAARVGLKPTLADRRLVAVSLSVLEVLGLAYRLPASGPRKTGTKAYRWVHSCFRNHPVTIPKWSSEWKVFNALSQGAKPTAQLPQTALENVLGKLEAGGLIKRTTGFKASIDLTPKGQALSEEQNKTNHLLPELREVFLGKPLQIQALRPDERRALFKLKRWARVKQELLARGIEPGQPVTRGAIKAAVDGLKEQERFVERVRAGQTPFAQVSARKIDIYIKALKAEAPTLAEIVERFWQKQEAKKERGQAASPKNEH